MEWRRDARCENCMVHCGYELTARAWACRRKSGDTWKNIKYNFGAKPKPVAEGSEVNAYTGVSSGNGHLTGRQERSRNVLPSQPSD